MSIHVLFFFVFIFMFFFFFPLLLFSITCLSYWLRIHDFLLFNYYALNVIYFSYVNGER